MSRVTGHYNLPSGVAGAGRDYYLRRDSANTSDPKELVLLLHGLDGTPGIVQAASGATPFSDTNDFVLAYPNGGGNWAAGDSGGSSSITRDDEGYLLAVIDDIVSKTPIDTTKIKIWGFSKGGMMASTMGVRHGDVIAAVGCMSGHLMVPATEGPVMLRHLHGAADTTVPAYGGYSAYLDDTMPDMRTESARTPAGSRCFGTRLANLGHAWATTANSSLSATQEFWTALRQFHT